MIRPVAFGGVGFHVTSEKRLDSLGCGGLARLPCFPKTLSPIDRRLQTEFVDLQRSRPRVGTWQQSRGRCRLFGTRVRRQTRSPESGKYLEWFSVGVQD